MRPSEEPDLALALLHVPYLALTVLYVSYLALTVFYVSFLARLSYMCQATRTAVSEGSKTAAIMAWTYRVRAKNLIWP